MQTAPPPASTLPATPPPAAPVVPPRGAPWADAAIIAGLVGLALALRWPHLWTVPRFTDETLEVLHSLRIVRDGALPLTNYDSYYGALYNYLVAAALWASGASPFAPRLVVLGAGVLTVAATYLLGRALACRLTGDRRLARVAGTLAALLLAMNGAHVVVNSHIAWSNCLTPLFTTLACWALLRFGAPGLALAGLLLGLALQTHPLVAALLPGAAAYVAWRGTRASDGAPLHRTPWPYVGVGLFLLGYANVLLYNWETGFESLRSAQRIRAEYAEDQQAAAGYLPTLGALLLLLGRALGGAVDQRDGAGAYLADPAVLLGGALTAFALIWSARRGEPLPLLLTLSFVLLLPLFNPKFRTLLTSRYLLPLVPVLFAALAAALACTIGPPRAGARGAGGRRGRGLRIAAAAAAVALVLAPLAPLGRYYARAYERGDTNERILGLVAQVAAARRVGEPVLVDEAIGSELPDTGVTELRGLEYLLELARVPHRSIRVSPSRLQEELRGDSALAILNARDAAAAAGRLSVTSLDPRPPAATGRMFDYRLYRLERRGLGVGERVDVTGLGIPDPRPPPPGARSRA